jgi:hypothetical protein
VLGNHLSVCKSAGLFPKWLCQLLIVGAACYIVDLLAAFLVPDFGRTIHGFIVVPCAIAEIRWSSTCS